MDVPRFTLKADFRTHPLLSSIATDDVAALDPHVRVVEHRRGARLTEAGRPVVALHFIFDGLICVRGRAADGGAAETGLLGPGGLVGVMASLGSVETAGDAIAIMSARSYAFETAGFEPVVRRSPLLRRALLDYAALRMTQLSQLCVCAALHSIEQRLARWLSAAAALRRDRPVDITHQQLAELLGVRRASVTAALHVLEGEQAVRCRRGRVEIRDAARLESRSCGCHHVGLTTDKPLRDGRGLR